MNGPMSSYGDATGEIVTGNLTMSGSYSFTVFGK